MNAIGFRNGDEIGCRSCPSRHVALVEQLLPLPHHARYLLSMITFFTGSFQAVDGRQFLQVHLEAAVAEMQITQLRIGELHANAAGRPNPIAPRPPDVMEPAGRVLAIALSRHIWC